MTRPRFGMAARPVTFDAGLSVGARLLWVVLDTEQGQRQWLIWPGGQAAIGQVLGVTRDTVAAWTGELVAAGLVEVTRTQRGTRYVVHNPARQRNPVAESDGHSIAESDGQRNKQDRETRNNNAPPHETGTPAPQPPAVVVESDQGIQAPATVAADAIADALEDTRQGYARVFYANLPAHLGNGLNRRSKTISGHLEEARLRRWPAKALAAAVGAELPNGNPRMVTGVLGALAATDAPKTPKAAPAWCGSCGLSAYPDATADNPPPAQSRWIEHDGPPAKCRCHPGHPDNLAADQPAAVA